VFAHYDSEIREQLTTLPATRLVGGFAGALWCAISLSGPRPSVPSGRSVTFSSEMLCPG